MPIFTLASYDKPYARGVYNKWTQLIGIILCAIAVAIAGKRRSTGRLHN